MKAIKVLERLGQNEQARSLYEHKKETSFSYLHL